MAEVEVRAPAWLPHGRIGGIGHLDPADDGRRQEELDGTGLTRLALFLQISELCLDLPEEVIAVEKGAQPPAVCGGRQQLVDVRHLEPHGPQVHPGARGDGQATQSRVETSGAGAREDVDLEPAEPGDAQERTRQGLGRRLPDGVDLRERPADPDGEAHASTHGHGEAEDAAFGRLPWDRRAHAAGAADAGGGFRRPTSRRSTSNQNWAPKRRAIAVMGRPTKPHRSVRYGKTSAHCGLAGSWDP